MIAAVVCSVRAPGHHGSDETSRSAPLGTPPDAAVDSELMSPKAPAAVVKVADGRIPSLAGRTDGEDGRYLKARLESAGRGLAGSSPARVRAVGASAAVALTLVLAVPVEHEHGRVVGELGTSHVQHGVSQAPRRFAGVQRPRLLE